MPVIPSIWGWRQKDQKSTANHGYIATLKPGLHGILPQKNQTNKRAPHLTGNKKGDETRGLPSSLHFALTIFLSSPLFYSFSLLCLRLLCLLGRKHYEFLLLLTSWGILSLAFNALLRMPIPHLCPSLFFLYSSPFLPYPLYLSGSL